MPGPGCLVLAFKKGGLIMAIKAQAPIVPVTIQSGRAAVHRGSRVIHSVTISVRVGEPIETAGLSLADRVALIVRVRADCRGGRRRTGID